VSSHAGCGRTLSGNPLHGWFVALVGLAVVVVAGCSSGAGERAQHAPLPGLTPKRLAALRASAIRAAARMGETDPTDGIVVATTQHAVFHAEPDGPRVYGPDFKVYVVAFAGKLTASDASRPPGARAPTGRFAYAIHRADTLAVTDAILGKPFDLAALGPHVRLELEKAERQRAMVYTEMYFNAGNTRRSVLRVSSATRVRRGLWRVEVIAPGLPGRVRYSCFTVRLDRFYVRTGPTDEVSSAGIEARNRRCPRP
jgi:hypothetical protein